MSVDYDPEMIAEFVSEAAEGLDRVETDMISIEREGVDAETVGRIFRAVHSIKGSAGFMGFTTLVAVAHQAETLMDLVRGGHLDLDGATADALLAAVDGLKALLAADNLGEGSDVSAVIAPLQAIIARHEAAPAAPSPMDGARHWVLTVDLDHLQKEPDCRDGVIAGLEKVGRFTAADRSREDIEHGSGTARIEIDSPIDGAILADLFHLDPTAVQEAGAEATAVGPSKLSESAPLDAVAPTAKLPLAKRNGGSPKRSDTSTPRSDGTMRVSARFLDELLTFTSNMVMARNQMMNRYSFGDDISFATLSRSITDLHKRVVQQRMETIGNLFGRFNRMVRDLARKLGKEVDLVLEGTEIELDRTIIEAFADPLAHMVRNALDHALEPPEERAAVGKNRVGRLVLRAYHQSGEVIVEVEDDGRGIEAGVISRIAIEKGVISAEVCQRLNAREQVALIFEPGFSTRSEASDISGRGVGMDVVKTNIESIGGAIEVHTNPGSGTIFAFRLPLTQAVVSSSLISALVVGAGGQRFAIPESAVNEIIRLDPQDADDRVRVVEGRQVYQLRDRVLSIVHLEGAVGLGRTFVDAHGRVRPDRRARIADRRSAESPEQAAAAAVTRSGRDRRRTRQTLVVVEFRRSYFGLLVDSVAGVEEVVVRSSPKLVADVAVFSGHTVLGDGSVVMMTDINGIVETMGLEFSEESAQTMAVRGALKTAQQMVVFDNAPGEFFAVPLMMISLIERVVEADIKRVGSREFCQFKDATIPILRLEEHLDVTSNRHQGEYHLLLPARLEKPIGLLVGNSLSVEDFSDSFDSRVDAGPGLIGTAYRDDRLIMLLDVYALFEKVMPEVFKAGLRGEHLKQTVRVLMVEDNRFFAKLAASYLTHDRIDLVKAEDGKEAWDLLIKQGASFDLIVSDIEMPRMNGFELVRNIKHNPDLRHIPVIALTSLADADSRRRGLKAGFDEYAVKIDKEELLTMVFSYLDGQRTVALVGAGSEDA